MTVRCSKCGAPAYACDCSPGWKAHPTALEKARNTARLANYYWLIAAREALQGDMGKLRAKVAMADGKCRADVAAEMSLPTPARRTPQP